MGNKNNVFTPRQQEQIQRCILDIMKQIRARNEKTKELQRMAHLAKLGQKETAEFKELEMKCWIPTVITFGDTIAELNQLGVRKGWKGKMDEQ